MVRGQVLALTPPCLFACGRTVGHSISHRLTTLNHNAKVPITRHPHQGESAAGAAAVTISAVPVLRVRWRGAEVSRRSAQLSHVEICEPTGTCKISTQLSGSKVLVDVPACSNSRKPDILRHVEDRQRDCVTRKTNSRVENYAALTPTLSREW
jgi:hypothetical protein